jgi:Dyp-type peroxidase family
MGVQSVRKGLRILCNFFERIEKGILTIDRLTTSGEIESVSLSDFNFSATIGFGIGFFNKLNLINRPRRLYEMPDHIGLGDIVPYTLRQTDMIIQIGSTSYFANRWVLNGEHYPLPANMIKKYSQQSIKWRDRAYSQDKKNVNDFGVHDIYSATREWAMVTDVHSGFQRLDGRNLMGFRDGISQPRGHLLDRTVWTTTEDEEEKLKGGTYMVFQKIEHDLEQWKRLSISEQEKWIGRSKRTGLILGTLSREEDEKLASDCRSDDPVIRKIAIGKLKKLLAEQNDPEKNLFDSKNPRLKGIQLECPVWSHVRKTNPRGADGAPKKIIFRRGYLFIEDNLNGRSRSGILFICFQRDISNGFEYIKRNFLNNEDFPVPELRKGFTKEEMAMRHSHGCFDTAELKGLGKIERNDLALESKIYDEKIKGSGSVNSQNTGREGLNGPSRLGINPLGEFLATVTLGGGYYFVPPLTNGAFSEVGQLFFE